MTVVLKQSLTRLVRLRYSAAMSSEPRSLMSNAVGSVLASGMLLFSTILIPAILARTLPRVQFDAYALVLASLPLVVLVPQSVRTVAATQLALAIDRFGDGPARRGYAHFVAWIAAIQTIAVIAGIEIYIWAGHSEAAWHGMVRFGLYSLLVYALGLIAAGLAVAPAAAHRDFRPDNLAKLWPGLFQLGGVMVVWASWSKQPLPWIFGVYAASSWSVVLLLRAVWRVPSPAKFPASPSIGLQSELFHGLRGVLWWNVTAYLATTSTVLIVAVGFPAYIVPFSVAVSLVGLVSAALVAASGPIAAHATAMVTQSHDDRRSFFLQVSAFFQCYILLAVIAILIAPISLYAIWLTPSLAPEVKWFSMLLLPATATRLLTMALTVFVMSAGRQRTLWFSPMVEAVVAVAGSLLLGSLLGVVGIPIALFASAATRLALTILYDEPRNRSSLALIPGDVLLSAWRLVRRRAC